MKMLKGLIISAKSVLDSIKTLDTKTAKAFYDRAKKNISSCGEVRACYLIEMTSYDRVNIEKDFYEQWLNLMAFEQVDFFIFQEKVWTVLPSIGVSPKVTNIAIVPLKEEYQKFYQEELRYGDR